MHYKKLAHTGVEVPDVGLGTHRYTGGVEPLRRGIQEGALLIDTAESYGTEALVGKAVTDIRDRVIIATKVAAVHFRYKDLIEAAERSLRSLNMDVIDLYQLHRFNPNIPLEETIGAMEVLADAGKIRFIGVCNFSVARLKRARAALTKYSIVSNQVDYSLITRSVESGLLSYCRENGITVIAHSPLGRGLANIQGRDRRHVLPALADATGKSEAQLCLNWCVCQDNVIAIPKANSAAHIVENCQASGWRLSYEQINSLEKSIGPFRRRGRTEAALRRLARSGLGRFLPR